MCEESDFDILDGIIEPQKELVDEPAHPTLVKSDWTAFHNKFTRKAGNDKSIFQDVEGLGLSKDVVNAANEIFQSIMESKGIKGKGRKGIVCTCVYYAANQVEPNNMSYDEAIRIFKIDTKLALKGFKTVNSCNNFIFTRFTATPETYIKLFLKKFDTEESEIESVLRMYSEFSDLTLSNLPRPQSIAAAFIFYWLKERHDGIVKIEYLSLKANVSQLTIEKLEKEMRREIDLKKSTEKIAKHNV
jgi:transcription initiation factor TFIIIB Brf1 subunit/transcription initiation factor TFIIB